MIRATADALLAALLAPCCACCRSPLDSPTRGAVCATCWASIPSPGDRLCEICGDALAAWRTDASGEQRCSRCRRTSRVIAFGRSIGAYEGVLRDILHALKYEGRRSVARPLGRRMRDAGARVLEGADVVVPVPLHLTRHYTRGFNQAAELAAHLGLPIIHALKRTRATTTQTDLPEGQRHANVKGAFAARRPLQPGTTAVIVDDVSTTGATVDACARALLAAGAREVRALTAARATARLP